MLDLEPADNVPFALKYGHDRRKYPPIRVLHVLEATLGGTRRYLEDIAETTAEVPVVQGLVYGTARADEGFSHLLKRLSGAGWFLSPVDAMRRRVSFMDDVLSVRRLRRAVREFRPDVLHLHSAKGGGIGRVATLARGTQGPRVVYSPHSLPARLGASYRAAEHVLASRTDRFIAVSESERREIIEEGLATGGRVDVVYPRIDAERYSPRDQKAARRELGLPDDVPIVIGIGRLASQKDPISFVATIARLRSAVPNVLGLWVGDGELRDEVGAAASRFNLGKSLQIVGWQSDVRPYVAASDILLSTSRYESFGYVVAEAFAMRRPVVATRVTGTVDVFYPAAESLMYPAGRVDHAVVCLQRLLGDQTLRHELGHLGRLRMIEKFSKSVMRSALSRSYAAALA